MQSEQSKLENAIYQFETQLKASGWADDEIRKYLKRIVKEYYQQKRG